MGMLLQHDIAFLNVLVLIYLIMRVCDRYIPLPKSSTSEYALIKRIHAACFRTFGCDCPSGFAGESCEIVLTGDCIDFPCHNGGYCDNVNYASGK